MAGFSNIKLQLPSTVGGDIPDNLHQPINDLYLAFANLIQQLNGATPVMMSPNGHFWRATISNAGTVTWTDVGTVRP
jgi:hypothetical protein